ncbi:MAG: hypothetical protein JOY94_06740, partial [Methylobacteriaceae bacterium]|nr:hypothetical protein [Methylobacteriaceae bacterium]
MGKRVLMVTEALARGGAERQMLALARGLLDRGFHVDVMELFGVVDGQASFEEEFRALGIEPRRALDMLPQAGDHDLVRDVCRTLAPYEAILPTQWDRIVAGLCARIGGRAPEVVHCWSDLANV